MAYTNDNQKWDEWAELEDEMAQDIQKYVDRKLEDKSKSFKVAIMSGIIEKLTINIRNNVELKN